MLGHKVLKINIITLAGEFIQAIGLYCPFLKQS